MLSRTSFSSGVIQGGQILAEATIGRMLDLGVTGVSVRN